MGFRISLVVVFIAFIRYTLQTCTDGQYDDPANPGTCLACVSPCANCSDASTCTSCLSSDMIFATPNCNF